MAESDTIVLRLSELYTSVQGEGPNTGRMTQFVRFGGCNMRCPGWPCDTLYAVEPKYRNEWEKITDPWDLIHRVDRYPNHLCLTGGEPLIQNEKDLNFFVEHMMKDRGCSMDVFTNGSQGLPPWTQNRACTIILDWKLPGSGEETTGLAMRIANVSQLRTWQAIKFVVTGEEDLDQALEVFNTYHRKVTAQWWVGAAWGHITDQEIIDYVQDKQLPWVLNVQVHKHIWSPTERGV